jgi:hypothetical protein
MYGIYLGVGEGLGGICLICRIFSARRRLEPTPSGKRRAGGFYQHIVPDGTETQSRHPPNQINKKSPPKIWSPQTNHLYLQTNDKKRMNATLTNTMALHTNSPVGFVFLCAQEFSTVDENFSTVDEKNISVDENFLSTDEKGSARYIHSFYSFYYQPIKK